ncbi:beta/alpha barrel domain-containing protein [Legionella tunisiensis]|uniref:hypothetical protein n=1 Tax=Legionella tunisiensis TaxID=1034944 RepID=UPI0002F83EE8
MLDDAGLDYVKITASNQLDEFIVKNLLDQGAPIDSFGVGTNLVIGAPDAALDGVYKLAFVNNKPCIKLSDTLAKITIPYKKQVFRVLETDNTFCADVIALRTEKSQPRCTILSNIRNHFSIKDYTLEPLLHKVMEKGQRLLATKPFNDIAKYSQQRINQLPQEYKRFSNPHRYKIGLSEQLHQLRNQLIAEHRR